MDSGLDALFSLSLFALLMLVLRRPIMRAVDKPDPIKRPDNSENQ